MMLNSMYASLTSLIQPSILSVSAGLLLITFLFLRRRFKEDDINLPPGPPSLPFVGSAHKLYEPFWQWMKDSQFQSYGQSALVYFKLGNKANILLNTYEVIEEAFVRNADVFAGRPNVDFLRRIIGKGGIILNENEVWRVHRRFATRTLKDFGVGRPLVQKHIQEEVLSLREELQRSSGQSLDPGLLLSMATCNIICLLVFGRRLASEEPRFTHMLEKVNRATQEPVFQGGLLTVIIMQLLTPLMRLPGFGSIFPMFRKAIQDNALFEGMVYKEVINHRTHFDGTSVEEPKDFIDAFLHEKQKRSSTVGRAEEEDLFSDHYLVRVILDLFIAGTDTTANTIRWALLYLSIHQEEQRRVQNQIDEVLGTERLPGMADRRQLPLLEAVIEETNRLCSLVPTGFMRRAKQSIKIQGFTIPQNCTVYANLHAVHHDPIVFPQPDEFLPDRFLKNGVFESSERVIPFSLGRRACLGEALARAELFIILGSILQTFKIDLDSSDRDRISEIMRGSIGTVHAARKFGIQFTSRHS